MKQGLICLMLFFSFSALAKNDDQWVKIGSSAENGLIIYRDDKFNPADNTIMLKTVWDKQPSHNLPQENYDLRFTQFNCQTSTMRTIAFYSFDVKNKLIESWQTTDQKINPYITVSPNTLGAQIIESLCGHIN